MSLPQNFASNDRVKEITDLLDRDDHNRADWVEIKLAIAALLFKTRKEFADNKSFGKWFEKHLGASIGVNERAAYIAMGAEPDHAREVFEKTERTSIQLIFEKEFKPQIGHNSKRQAHNKGKSKAGAAGFAGAGTATAGTPVRKPVFTLKEFNQLVKVLHSDRKAAITVAEMDKALALVMAHKDDLLGSKEQQKAEKAKAKAEKPAAQPQPEPQPAA